VGGFVPPGNPDSADPYAESGERRARVPKVAWVGSCKTLIMGSNPIVASRQHQTTQGNTPGGYPPYPSDQGWVLGAHLAHGVICPDVHETWPSQTLSQRLDQFLGEQVIEVPSPSGKNGQKLEGEARALARVQGPKPPSRPVARLPGQLPG
jgi:hypothetical protein